MRNATRSLHNGIRVFTISAVFFASFFAGESGLEIVPVNDLADVSPSGEVKVKILKDGQPLAGADVCLTQAAADKPR
jgi:uncharacterized GH25 family protein